MFTTSPMSFIHFAPRAASLDLNLSIPNKEVARSTRGAIPDTPRMYDMEKEYAGPLGDHSGLWLIIAHRLETPRRSVGDYALDQLT